jgi:hypothetical protein
MVETSYKNKTKLRKSILAENKDKVFKQVGKNWT